MATGRRLALLAALALATSCRERPAPTPARAPAAPALADPANDDAQTGGTGGQPPVLPDAVRNVEGVVVSARGDEIVVHPAEGEPVAITVGDGVPVTVEGRAAPGTELGEGTRVRAAYTFESGNARAVRIDVERAPR